MEERSFDPSRRYVAACTDGTGKEIEVTPSFWSDLGMGKYPELSPGWLVAAFPVNKDWTNWEMHPEGEEILTLLSGEVELVLENGDRKSSVRLRTGETFVMPRGTWHRAVVYQPGTMLGITWGRGTRHREMV